MGPGSRIPSRISTSGERHDIAYDDLYVVVAAWRGLAFGLGTNVTISIGAHSYTFIIIHGS